MVAIKLLLEMNSLDKVGILENQSRSFSMLVRQDQRVRQLQLLHVFPVDFRVSWEVSAAVSV